MKREIFTGGFALMAVAAMALQPNAEGFTDFTGKLQKEAPGNYFIIRYEYPDGVYTNRWMKGLPRWVFTEVRQLKEDTTVLTDGVLSKSKKRVEPRNWAKWLRPGARNVRIKFVGADYSLAADGRETAPQGFVELFNGRDLTGWKGALKEGGFNTPGVRRAASPEKMREVQKRADELMVEHWHVRDGALFFDGLPGGYSLATAKDYGNFELMADWRLLRTHGDSGFYLRGLPQVQIWDPNTWGGLGSGGIYNNKKALSNALSCEDRPIGDWNRCRMRMVGDRLTVWLNGVKIVDDVQYEYSRKPGVPIPLIERIELQCHGDPVEFRNIFIRELPEDPADIPDPAKATRGVQINLLAEGMDGWVATDPKARMGWSLEGGVLSNNTGLDPKKTGRGGAGTTHLQTKRTDFFDFDFSCDVLVPKGCNSGVYLRGRYEIQVKDSYGRKPDCHNMGALYDLITPSVAAEKPAGEWQHIDLTLYKRHLTVKLNGVKIIENKPIAGVTPLAINADEMSPGPILLQGDHSNASFRNMVLTPILK